jgi:hypothetical protein
MILYLVKDNLRNVVLESVQVIILLCYGMVKSRYLQSNLKD